MHKAYIRASRPFVACSSAGTRPKGRQRKPSGRSCESFGLYRRIGGPQTIHLVPGVAGYSSRTFLLKS
jgi:hypothetical protein